MARSHCHREEERKALQRCSVERVDKGCSAVASVDGDGNGQSDAQAIAQTARVTLTLARQGSSAPAAVHTLALGTGAQGPQAQAEITGLTPVATTRAGC